MSTATDKRISEPEPVMGSEVTLVDETLHKRCPGCDGTVEVVIPKGSAMVTARLMHAFSVMCTACAEADDAREMERERLRIRERNISNCQMPPELRRLSFDSYDTSRKGAANALAAARAWSLGQHERRGIMLCGPVGVGKTRLAATAAWAAMGEFQRKRRRRDGATLVPGVGVRWVNVADLIVKLGAAFGDKDRAEALRILTGRGGIVLDDLDKINPSQFVLSHLYTAIDGRMQHAAPMFVTTNLFPDQLREKLARRMGREDAEERRVIAESIVSRLTGYCTVHGITGPDGRQV
jgi:DNA replication protein DnaC